MAILIINLVLCVIILGLGIWGYSRKKNDALLYIGIAFGLFAISHLFNIVGFSAEFDAYIIAIRLLAYLLVLFGVYRIISKK